ncbi:MAG: hypothetical protein ABSH24_00695 [Bryobacteraceae bacterium]|jgi:hypothetical protein
MAEGEVAVHRNAEVARFTIDWTVPRVQPGLRFLEIHSTMGKRRREIKYSCLRRTRPNDSGGILVMTRIVDTLDERPDIGLIFRHDVLSPLAGW